VYGGPAADTAQVNSRLDARAIQLANELDVEYLEYRSTVRTRPDWACKDGLYATFQRPIHPTPDDNLRAIPRKQRAVVRKSLLAGLTATIEDEPDVFYRLYAESVRNLGTPVFGRSFFRNLKDQFADRCEILVVRHGAEPVAGVITFYFRDVVLPIYAGGSPAARRLGAFDFMYWDILRRACEAGYRVFDFGRSKVGTGAFDFKKNWGFTPLPLEYEYWLRNGSAIPNVSPVNPKYRLFIEAWKRLPLPAANLLGPVIASNLG
jgi:FemAB-related protein (PEP-CTERM system-associated)